MRMICPNCGAQYEVDAEVIPEAGRDVQCSNCGHTWFQRRAGLESLADESPAAEPSADSSEPAKEVDADEADEVEDQVEVAQDGAQGDDTAADDAKAPGGDEPEAAEAATTDMPPKDDAPQDTPDADDPSQSPPEKQSLDKGVADILRQEAERETEERSTESGGLETQPDLGIDQGGDAQGGSAERSAQLHASETDDVQEGARRDLLPDIEEINSTLAASSDSDVVAETVSPDARRRSGFRRGFSLALVIFAVLALIYVFSARIVDAVPQLAAVLSWYVDWINTLRNSADGLMQRAVERLTALLAQLSGGDTG